MEEEEPTLPAPGGRGKGLYACEYALLARIAALTAAGRVALLHGDAQARPPGLPPACAPQAAQSRAAESHACAHVVMQATP